MFGEGVAGQRYVHESLSGQGAGEKGREGRRLKKSTGGRHSPAGHYINYHQLLSNIHQVSTPKVFSPVATSVHWVVPLNELPAHSKASEGSTSGSRWAALQTGEVKNELENLEQILFLNKHVRMIADGIVPPDGLGKGNVCFLCCSDQWTSMITNPIPKWALDGSPWNSIFLVSVVSWSVLKDVERCWYFFIFCFFFFDLVLVLMSPCCDVTPTGVMPTISKATPVPPPPSQRSRC